MAVAVVDTGTAAYHTTAVTQNYTFTVSSGATLAVFFIGQDTSVSITSVTWDSGGTNQACTQIGTVANGSFDCSVFIYAVVNPTVGSSKTLQVVNSSTTAESAQLQSYSGTKTSSATAACTNVLTASGTSGGTASNVGTAAQSGANGDMYVSCYATTGGINSVSDTQVFLESNSGDDHGGNRFASTGTSHSLTANITSTSDWAAISCDIVASTASPARQPRLKTYLRR